MPDSIKDALDKKFEQSEAKLDKAIENSATKAEVESIVKTLTEQGESLQTYIESVNKNVDKTFEEAYSEFLKENKEKLNDIIKSNIGEIEFIFDAPIDKAVGNITSASGGDVTAAPVNHNTSLSRVKLRDDSKLITLCNVIQTSKPSFPYTETYPKDGDYAFVAEGAQKPQIDFQWAVRYAEPFKIAAHEILTEEVVRDIPRIMSTAKGYLKDRHDLFKANALYFSDGTGGTPTGATVVGRTFVAGAMALGVETPNIMDVINAIITDICTTHNYADETPYSPNIVLMNPTDFFLNFQAAKDGNRLAMYGGVHLFNEYSVGGITIKPWEKIPPGKIFVGDMKKYNISNWVRYSVRIGWINEQFIDNKFTMVGESRFHAFVKNFDQQAFIYDDIATIKTAITKA